MGTCRSRSPSCAFDPDRVTEWRQRWGESARPLLWSQAAYLALRVELETFGRVERAYAASDPSGR